MAALFVRHWSMLVGPCPQVIVAADTATRGLIAAAMA